MRPYVQDIANRRAVEKDDVKKECQKKSMNTLYGKSCQDQRGYRNVNPHFDQEEFERQVAKRNVTDWDVIKSWSEEDERFFALIETATEKGVVLNTPRLMGFSVLELSKLHIFEAHYGYYKEKYGDKAKFLFTDTDSLCYLIETEDVLLDMANEIAKAMPKIHFDIIGSASDAFLDRLCGDNEKSRETWMKRFKKMKGKLGASQLESLMSRISEFAGCAS